MEMDAGGRSLPPEVVVVRGGPMQGRDGSNTMLLNATTEFLKSGRWALSVFSWPGLSALEIAAEWRYEGKHMQESTLNALAMAGFEVVPDPRPDVVAQKGRDTHALLMLGGPPTEETWERLRGCFGPEMQNPHYQTKHDRR